jgi:hypothetical protein
MNGWASLALHPCAQCGGPVPIGQEVHVQRAPRPAEQASCGGVAIRGVMVCSAACAIAWQAAE